MKRYPDAKFYLNDTSIVDFIRLVSDHISENWYKKELEESESKFLSDDMLCFIGFAGTARECALWLAQSERGYMYVANIVPKAKSSLTEDEYGELINDFIAPKVISILESANVRIDIQSVEFQVQDVLDKDTVDLLKTFSSCANKSTGTAHPRDAKRWFKFIFSSFKNGEIDTHTLHDFLIEDGWAEDMAFELIIKYEYSIDLLKDYEGLDGY